MDSFRQWLSNELDRRGWSHGQFAKKAELSRPLVSQTIKGDVPPSANFCIKTAAALDESPVKLLRMAGILPPGSNDPTIEEITDLLESMSPDQQKQVLEYVKFISR